MSANVLIAYVLFATSVSVVTGRNLWPFSNWPVMTKPAPREFDGNRIRVRVVGITRDNAEHPIDWRTWQPWSYQELVMWAIRTVPQLPADERRWAGQYMLSLANRGREQARAGRRPGTWSRPLGPLTSPANYFRNLLWTNPESVPREPFVGLRIDEQHYDILRRLADSTAVEFVRVFEYHEP